MILVDPPEAPFEIIYDADTSDTLLNITPPAGSQRMYLNAPGDKLDGWNKKKQAGSHTVWSTRNSDYDTGVVGTVRILNDPTDQVYLTNVDGSNKGLHLLPDGISVDTTAHTITEEFIVENTSESNSPTVIDDCSDAANWSISQGSGDITVENGKIKVVGTSDQSGYLKIQHSVPGNTLQNKTFVWLSVSSNVAGSFRLGLSYNTGSNYKTWESATRFAIAQNTETRYVYPLACQAGSSGTMPSTVSGVFVVASVTSISCAILITPNTSVTFYIDNITADTAKSAYVELQVPDNLADSSLQLQVFDGSAYQTTGVYKLDSSYEAVGSLTSANWKFADGTKFDDCYGSWNGRALFPKGASAETKVGSKGSITYSANKGTSKRIGFRVDLPPSDGERTDFNKIRLRTILRYTDTVGNVVPDLSGCGNHGTIVGGVTKYSDALALVSGSGYVSTNLCLTAGMSIEVECEVPANIAGDYDVIIGGKVSASTMRLYRYGSDTLNVRYYSNSSVKTDAISNALPINTRTKIFLSYISGRLLVKVNDVTKIDKSVVIDFPTTDRFYLGSYSDTDLKKSNVKYYSIKIYSGGNQVLEYTPTVQNMGSTTFEFTPQSLDHFTGLDNVGNWIAFERPDKRAEVFLFSRKLPSLSVTEDENGYITNIEIGVKKGTRVARAWIRYPDFDADGNSDDVPNFIDKIVEQLQNKFAFTRKYTNEVDLSGVAVVANDFSITLGDCDPVYAVSTGSRVYDSDGNLIPASETVVTASGSMDLIPVNGESTINIVGDELLNYGECKVFDTVTAGNATESTWLRVYDVNHVFTGDTIIENGLIRLKISTSAIYIFRYSGGNYVRLYGTGDCALRALVWNGTASETPVYRNYSFITISPEKIILEEQNGAASASENTLRYTILRGLFCLKSETLVNSTLRYITTNTTASNRAFYIVDEVLYDSGFGTGYISIPTTTGIGMRFEPDVNSIVAVMLHDNSIHVFKPTAIGSIFSSGVLQKTSFIVVPYSQGMYWEAESCGYTVAQSNIIADVNAYGGSALNITGNTWLQKTFNNVLGAGVYTYFVRIRGESPGNVDLIVYDVTLNQTITTAVKAITADYTYISISVALTSAQVSHDLRFITTKRDVNYIADYMLLIPTGLIEKHAKRALINLNEVKTYKEV